jgi:hypothetical protein
MFVWKWKGEVKIEDEEETLIKQGIGKTGGGGLGQMASTAQGALPHCVRWAQGENYICRQGYKIEDGNFRGLLFVILDNLSKG